MQLIVIWEFSTAVSPTSVGGSAVAFFLLAKEKLPGAKTIIFFYGLFINPRAIKRLLLFVSRFPLLKRFREELRSTAFDVVTSAVKIKEKPLSFHIKAFIATAGAWTVRFLAINCLILAFVSGISPEIFDHFIILSRGMAMHTIEALVWRLIGYYSYLIAGVIIIPMWFRQVSLKNRVKKGSEK